MSNKVNVIDRAFELARGGSCKSIDDIRRALVREGYTGSDLMEITARVRNELSMAWRAARRRR
jgi:murein tripeptide amidase MpaA